MALTINGASVDLNCTLNGNQLEALIVNGLYRVWENWSLKSTRTSVGSAGGVNMVTLEKCTWEVPVNYRVVKLYCYATVYCHTTITEEEEENGVAPATVSAKIEGYNGNSWEVLSESSRGASRTQGETVSRDCSYTFDPYNTIYTKFRFSSGGTSFRRTVTGYVDEWYEKPEIKTYTESTTLNFIVDEMNTSRYCGTEAWVMNELSVNVKNTYSVVWDGVTYECTAFDQVSSITFYDSALLGNPKEFGFTGGGDTGEPFFIIYSTLDGTALLFTTSTESSHTVEITGRTKMPTRLGTPSIYIEEE